MKPTKSDRRALAAFMAPALVMMLVFFVIPVLYVITVSVLKWNANLHIFFLLNCQK